MKTKLDFVTNSSSASVFLYIESSLDDLEKFKEKFSEYIESYKERYPEKMIHFWDPNYIQQLTPHLFIIEHRISMYNDVENVPHYIRTLVLESLIDVEKGKLSKFDIKGANVKVKMD